MIFWSIIAVLIVIVDQLTKYLVVTKIGVTDFIKVIPKVIYFVNVKNTGAAWSFLADKTYGIIILSVISVLFCVGVILYIVKKKPTSKLLKLSLALLFSGALGNAIDRIARGYVVDFIETEFITFPVFNVADIAITIGAILLIIFVLFFDKDTKEREEK